MGVSAYVASYFTETLSQSIGNDLRVRLYQQLKRVGIVGPTGSGKSTVVSLIPRFRDPDAGSITIDGVGIRDYKLRGLRSQIGLVLQDTVLLRGTVRDNIAFGRPRRRKH